MKRALWLIATTLLMVGCMSITPVELRSMEEACYHKGGMREVINWMNNNPAVICINGDMIPLSTIERTLNRTQNSSTTKPKNLDTTLGWTM